MSTLLTADWFQLDSYYRKFDLYTMNWAMDEGLENMIVSGGAYGGPIATVRDRKFVRISTNAKPVITIFNGAGNVISKILWNSGVLIHMGWSDAEQLLCVQESGDVLIYDMFGAYQKTFNLGQEVRDTKVSKAQLFTNQHGVGLGVITTTNRMFLVSNVSEPKVRPVPDLPRANEPISAWCVVNSAFLVCRDKEIFKCQLAESRAILMRPDIRSPYTQILSIVASQNGKHVALFTDSGHLWIGSSDFKTKYSEIDTGNIKQPKSLMWCGSQAIAGVWDDTLYMFGSRGSSTSFQYDGPFHLIQEMDCIRILSEYTHELLQKVPFVLEKIFRINSTAPGSYLLEASRQFQKRSHRADEYIRLVKPDLQVAVQDCIEAAAFEFNPDVQKLLIRAAQFGKSFIMDYELTDFYVKTCKRLRVLNAIRDPKVGMPLTSVQLGALGERVVIDRVAARRLHPLAAALATHLALPARAAAVLTHWARCKVSQPHADPDATARAVALRLRGAPGVSYAGVARCAAARGRPALALRLLELERRAALRVPLLLALGERRAALARAAAAPDPALLRHVLAHLKRHMATHEFELTIREYPLAQALYRQHCAAHDREALRQLLVQEDDFPAQAALHLRDAAAPAAPAAVDAALTAARECYKKAKMDLGAAMCEESRRLWRQQASLQEQFGAVFTGVPLQGTVRALLRRGELRLADKLRAEYKVPDRRYWWVRILTMAEAGDWEELDKFSKSKKSPIGYEPFVDACLKHDRADEAMRYLPRCREDIKIKYYVKAGYYEEAAQLAFEQRDESALLFVQNKCPLTETTKHAKITALLEQMPRK